jgi:hypothetical protein
MVASGGVVRSVVSGMALIVFYAFAFWRIAKRNTGNRVIECGCLTLVVFAVLMATINMPNLSDWGRAMFGDLAPSSWFADDGFSCAAGI